MEDGQEFPEIAPANSARREMYMEVPPFARDVRYGRDRIEPIEQVRLVPL